MENQQVDEEIRAWLMICALSAVKPGIFTRKKAERELRGYLATLGIPADGDPVIQPGIDGDPVILSEAKDLTCASSRWHAFAHRYIDLCLKSRSYGSTLMNLVPLSEQQTSDKLRNEINTVLRDYPALFGLDAACAPLRDIMLETLDSRR